MKRTPLRKVSKAHARELNRYRQLKYSFLRDNPFCFCGRISRDVHHKKLRGKHLNDVETFLAVCLSCHRQIHDHPTWAREQGYLL